jgi:GNAT superfamily N-acetyltransferase
MSIMLENKVNYRLRKIEQTDFDLLLKIYASTRQPELDQMKNWTESMKQSFVSQQFNAQHTHYQNNYLKAFFYIINKGKTGIGRLYLDEYFGENEFRIIDITLLPEWRGRGIGQQILKEILLKAAKNGKRVSIHVETFNPAMQLYFRLGFKKVSETNGVYHLLEWKN